MIGHSIVLLSRELGHAVQYVCVCVRGRPCGDARLRRSSVLIGAACLVGYFVAWRVCAACGMSGEWEHAGQRVHINGVVLVVGCAMLSGRSGGPWSAAETMRPPC